MTTLLSASIAMSLVATLILALYCTFKIATYSEYSKRYRWLVFASIVASLGPQRFMPLGLRLSTQFYSVRIDLYLAMTEKWLGYPSMLLGQFLHSHPYVALMAALDYNLMPMGMILLAVAYVKRAEFGRIVTLLMVNLFAAVPLYFMFPASGPLKAFPSFPAIPPPFSPRLVHIPTVPNCMPSVHFATTLLLVYFCWRWKWVRPVVIAHSLLTAVACLGFGEHYVIDLVASFPYAYCVWWVTFGRRSSVTAPGAGRLFWSPPPPPGQLPVVQPAGE